jgi:hypothetical protein
MSAHLADTVKTWCRASHVLTVKKMKPKKLMMENVMIHNSVVARGFTQLHTVTTKGAC